jgi:hypothetical protein
MPRGGSSGSGVILLLVACGALVLTCTQGHRPDTPAAPSGPSSGAVGVEYSFSSSAQVRDGDDVAIRFDWGDGDTSDWSPWVRPGDTVTMSHAWAGPGTFPVRAQAKARNITVSDWSSGQTLSSYYEWTRTFGGPSDDYGISVQQTLDSGYIILGNTYSYGAGEADGWLIKTDVAGHTEWEKTIGGAGDDWGSSVQQTRDGGYIVTGSTSTFGAGNNDFWLVKLDAHGHVLWQKTYGYAGGEVASSVQQTQDGGYVVAGVAEPRDGDYGDAWLIRTDTNGDTLWTRTYGGPHTDDAYWVEESADEGYVMAGYTSSFGAGDGDYWLVKTDASGDTVWTRTFGGLDNDACLSAARTQDGGYILTGYTYSYGAGRSDVWLVKTDADGRKVWDRVLGRSGYDYGEAVQQTADGGYVVGAASLGVWVIKTRADGDTMWTRDYYAGAGGERCSDVQRTRDGGYIIAGSTSSHGSGGSDVWLIKTDAEGRVHGGPAPDGFRVHESDTLGKR